MAGGQSHRLPDGGIVDREKTVSFTFDGATYSGHPGDTLASALIANGVKLVGRSFKYHRPRGFLTAGSEEPNALVELRAGARREANTRTTVTELYDGLEATSQNRWPSLRFDAMAVNDMLSPFLAAGFYYKTFMGPTRKAWRMYEHLIRRAAGLGEASRRPDPDRYDKTNAFCDVLVVGGGPAGLMAALSAATAGVRVIIADERPRPGGSLLGGNERVADVDGAEWATTVTETLASMPDVTVLPRSTVYGYFDHNVLGIVERVGDHLPTKPEHSPRQRHWRVCADQVVLATGAIEQPLLFGGNDRPGVMLAGAARTYVNQYAVRPGRRAVVVTNNDSGYDAALDLATTGVEVAAIADVREAPNEALVAAAGAIGIKVLEGHAVLSAVGHRQVRTAVLGKVSDGSISAHVDCDLIAVCGGWAPAVHLHAMAGSKPVYDPALAAFLPGEPREAWVSCGKASGVFALADRLADGARAGAEAARRAGFDAAPAPVPTSNERPKHSTVQPVWEVPAPQGRKVKKFVDLQHDVTATDVALAHREGYVSVEHLKRYTTQGMATDQGKTSNIGALALMAALRGESIPVVGTTTYRPPYTPVTIGALAGREIGGCFRPTRLTPMHDWHVAHGAEMITVGPWLRPRIYAKPGETVEQAYIREARAVRAGVGIVDVSTLGKIDVLGPDAAEFLNRVYVNGFKKLPVGKARYGIMLREDGHVFDDGTVWRLDEHCFLMTTTTANAAAVLLHLEHLLQVVWPDLRVTVTSVTEQWAAMAVAGPESRKTLAKVVDGVDMTDEALPFMGVVHGNIDGIPVLIARLSFSGELAYEVYAAADHGTAVWERIIHAGADFGVVPYGIEALGTLRIEKGHVAGPELDGRTTLHDIGFERMAAGNKHYVGKALMNREALTNPDRPRYVGLISGTEQAIRAGAHLVEGSEAGDPGPSLGHVSSSTYSPALGCYMALGFVRGGKQRIGQTLYAADPVRGGHDAVEVVDPVFFDPGGERMHG